MDKMITFRELDLTETADVYERDLVYDFPPDEQKPLAVIAELIERGRYRAYGMFERDDLVAYAFFATVPGSRDILIDYLAVRAKFRDRGYGGLCIRLMRAEFADFDSILFEVESGRSARDREEWETCQRRLSFYRKNGLDCSTVRMRLFRVDMVVLYLSLRRPPDDERIKFVLNQTYDDFFPDPRQREKIVIETGPIGHPLNLNQPIYKSITAK
ncbi:MAG: GNAT family N-acetyltransferase [Fastidiosipilaceae bacterium]|jgi:GNAT superfamily N-acetyltransferase